MTITQLTWKYRYFIDVLSSFPLDLFPVVGLLDHMAVLFLAVGGNSMLLSIMAILICIPTTSVPEFPFLCILVSICYFFVFLMTAVLNRFPATLFPNLQTPPVFHKQAGWLSSDSSIPYSALAKLCSQTWLLCPVVPLWERKDCEQPHVPSLFFAETYKCLYWWKGSFVHLHKETAYCLQPFHLACSPFSPSGSRVTTLFASKP